MRTELSESASSVTTPPANPLSPLAVMVALSPRKISGASSVISPEAAIEASLRWAVAELSLVTRRLEIVTSSATVIRLSACNVKLPAVQLTPPFDELSRNISTDTLIVSGSINTAPAMPAIDAADRDPPARVTVSTAENSTKPPSPVLPASAARRAPSCRTDSPSAIT